MTSSLFAQDTPSQHLPAQSAQPWRPEKARLLGLRLRRLSRLLRHGIPYARFFLALHGTSSGRMLYRHARVFDRKFLGPYLSTALTTRQKLRVQMHLVRFIEDNFTASFVACLTHGGLCLWQQETADGSHGISLYLADASKFEGDLALDYHVNGRRLHRLSFVFAPGAAFGLADRHTLFIGGSQGMNGGQKEARAAAKANGGLHPATMLVLALRAIAQALDIDGLSGISATHQLFTYTQQVPRPENYDHLWAMNSGEARGTVYHMLPTLAQTDDDITSGTHRARCRRRRRQRQQVLDAICREVRRYRRPGSAPPPSTPAAGASALVSGEEPVLRPLQPQMIAQSRTFILTAENATAL